MHDFMAEVCAFPLLTEQEETELAIRCAAGDEEAVRQMVQSNLRLVVSIGREYSGRGVPLLDLCQEGCIGLLAATKKYDYTKDCRFATYARFWIRQSMTRYLQKQDMIRVPPHTAEQMRRVREAQAALRQSLDTEPTVEEIAAFCGMEAEKVERLRKLQPQTCSLDAPAGEGDAVGTLIEDLCAPQPMELLVRQALIETMEKLLSMLPPRQARVLRLHYGMADGRRYSFEQIGTALGVSKERARQIEKQAIDRLKELGADIGLEDFLE